MDLGFGLGERVWVCGEDLDKGEGGRKRGHGFRVLGKRIGIGILRFAYHYLEENI